jgi:hypothetical protein
MTWLPGRNSSRTAWLALRPESTSILASAGRRLNIAAAAGVCALLLLGWPMRGYSQTQTPTGRVHIVPIRIAPKSATTSLTPATSGPSAPICVDSSGNPVTCLYNYYGGPVISNIDVVVVYWGKSVSSVVN